MLTLKANGRRRVHGCRPGRCLGSSGVSVLSRWYLGGASMVSRWCLLLVSCWCLGCVLVVPWWSLGGAFVVSQWCWWFLGVWCLGGVFVEFCGVCDVLMAIKIGNLLSNLGVWRLRVWRLRVWRCALLMVSRWRFGGVFAVSWLCPGGVSLPLAQLRVFFRVGHTMHQVVSRLHQVVFNGSILCYAGDHHC